VNDVMAVKVLNGLQHLIENPLRLRLRVRSLVNNAVEQISPEHVLHDEENVSVVLVHVKQLDDVGVAQRLQDLDLPFNASRKRLGRELEPGLLLVPSIQQSLFPVDHFDGCTLA
jgi:hypothetical protein